MSNERFGVDGARHRKQFATRLRASVQRPSHSQNHTSEARVAGRPGGSVRPEVKDAYAARDRDRIESLAVTLDITYTLHPGDIYEVSKWTERTLWRHADKTADVVFRDRELPDLHWDRPGFLMLLRAANRGRSLG